MICFEGEICAKIKYKIRKEYSATSCLIVAFALTILSVPFLLLGLLNNSLFLYVVPIVAIPSIILALVFLFADVIDLPRKVVIENEDIVATFVPNSYWKSSKKPESGVVQERDISWVEKVKDYGDWYEICFPRPYKTNPLICQKNLITSGTLEEFEKLFEGKIVKETFKFK